MTTRSSLHRAENNGHFFLALHSSSDTLGLALMDSRDPSLTVKKITFDIGRKLSQSLLTCVNQILPYKSWSELARISVATGPGGFTGTRLTIVMARTLAQQLNCPLDGVSSFALIAKRRAQDLYADQAENPFWITQSLRRGIVAGQYKLERSVIDENKDNIIELVVPRLFSFDTDLSPGFSADINVSSDVENLLSYSLAAHRNGAFSSWEDIVPIYPTSPVG